MWCTKCLWKRSYSAESLNRAWFTSKQNMRKQMSSPTSLSLTVLALGFAPSFAHPNVVEGTYGFELRRYWYVCIAEVTWKFISAICFIIVEARKKSAYKSSTLFTARRKAILASGVKMTKCSANSGQCREICWVEETSCTRGRPALTL
jgi:hypothetical protein